MKVLQLEIRTQNDIDTIHKMLVVYMAMKNIKLCPSDFTILASLILYRPTLKTRKYIMNEMQIFKKKTSFHNAIYKLKKLGLIRTDQFGSMVINPKIDIYEEKMGIIIKLAPKAE